MNQKTLIYILFYLLSASGSLKSQNVESFDSTAKSSKWGLSINPTSLLNYVGNLTTDSSPTPVWDGKNDDQFNIFYLKQKTENHFLQYGIGLFLNSSRSNVWVQALDGNSLPIDGQFVEDVYEENYLKLGLYLSKEKWVGENRIKGRFGYFSRLNVAFQNFNFLSENPLESLVGDTLFYSPGRTFEFQAGLIGGVSYFVTKNIFFSGDTDISMHLNDTRNSVLRRVEFDPIISSEPFVSDEKGSQKTSAYGIDIRFRPTLRLTFIF